MRNNNLIWIWILLIVVGLACAGCGGGSSTTPPPDGLHPGDYPNGDPPEPILPGNTPGQFTVPNGFGDLRGVAASQQYVYVADTTTLYCFDKLGNLVNFVASPSGVTIQGVGVFPPKPTLDLPTEIDYPFPGFPLILHNPITEYGYITIYGPNLDTLTTVEDQEHPDAPKYVALPFGQVDPPLPPDQTPWHVVNTYDVTVDRFGSIFAIVDMNGIVGTNTYAYRRGMQTFNVANGYVIEEGGEIITEDEQGNPLQLAAPIFDDRDSWAIGDLGTQAVDTFFPFNRTELQYTYYTGDYNLLRDFVGVTVVGFNPNTLPPRYGVGATVSNGFGYTRVLGETSGNAPGSFNQNPPINPDGGLEDPDLSNGGPSGMTCDPLTDNVMICDPGNRRIQVFAKDTGQFLRQIGDGTRGRSGNAFLAPSSVSVDYEGNIFVCDVTDLRVLRENLPNRTFGDVAGTVKRLDLGTPLEGATVTLGSELGALAARATNINGQYRISNLVTGTYYMTATKFNYDSDTATIQIISDLTVKADFNLNPRTPPTTGSYTGTVIDDFTNLWLADVVVSVVGTSLTTTTDDTGHFQILNLPPGVYQMVFTLDGYQTLTRDVEIRGGGVTTDPLLQMIPIS